MAEQQLKDNKQFDIKAHIVISLGFLREEREKEDRGRTGQRPSRTTLEAWKYHGRGRRSWQWTESSGENVLPDVQNAPVDILR